MTRQPLVSLATWGVTMKNEEKYVITIARQYGSGGKTVGKMLSERLSIPYYDRDLIRLAAEESGINEALFSKADERIKPSSKLFHLADSVYHGELLPPESKEFTSDENLFNYQAKIIKELADAEESCIIIGRCADYILRDYENVISVFVHAPREFCLQQAGRVLSVSGKELERIVDGTDRFRAEYYRYHTGREWTDARNYDLCLDSSRLGFARCVDEIAAYLSIRLKDQGHAV